MTENPVVSATDIDYEYGPVSVLRGLSLAIEAGTVVAVVGPNGGGKSTLLQTLAGVATPTSGTVKYPATGDIHPVGYLPQSFHPRADLTVVETVAYYDRLAGTGPTPKTLVDQVGLGAVANRRVRALSGGMRRLLGVAVAAAGDPELLVLDEPTSGLDRTMTRRVFDQCHSLATDDRSVVIATHDLPAVEEVADRALLLDRGRLRLDRQLPIRDAAFATAYDRAVDGEITVRSGREDRDDDSTGGVRS
ncbi:ABC transporter ATP-binding protein [Halobellus marinus]|jgi:ABC-type multidrug transport system ATPase subunit|uniref:ABC transporter ATP-binding protein n=1 Tax=Halobellus TaxID=1073986 RepID=UPI0028AE3883|nr:ABC transporter ATP-binding protein [Halobellus sp. DFY28]